ncbi:MAG: fimbrillin family protein [Alistipes sp.]|nr:fimbrillin family protein [Alistipes sp.]
MRKIFIAALAAVAMVSCAKDEAVEINKGEAIGFAATTGRVTRAATIDDITEFDRFRVWGFHKADATAAETALMTNIAVTKAKSGWFYGDDYYFWPSVGTCDFYGIYPTVDDVATSPITVNMANKTVSYDIYTGNYGDWNPTDWVYAVNVDEARQTTKVPMNFRHAMSQIVFQVKNTNKNLKVTIPAGTIDLICVSQKGVYTLPSEDTAIEANYADRVMGSWDVADLSEGHGCYTWANIEGAVLDGVSDCLVANFMAEDGAMITVPQTVAAYDYANDGDNTKQLAYFRMKVLIEQEETVIWPGYNGTSSNEQVEKDKAYWVAIPISAEWKEGKKYTYTFIFGAGAGIVPPGTPGPDDEDPNPVPPGTPILAPIDFTVTIDDIVDTDNTDIPLGSIDRP